MPWVDVNGSDIYYHELVAGSRLTAIEGAPHNVYWEAAEEYNAAVAKFLDEVL